MRRLALKAGAQNQKGKAALVIFDRQSCHFRGYDSLTLIAEPPRTPASIHPIEDGAAQASSRWGGRPPPKDSVDSEISLMVTLFRCAIDCATRVNHEIALPKRAKNPPELP
jgi:hypothetical protein